MVGGHMPRAVGLGGGGGGAGGFARLPQRLAGAATTAFQRHPLLIKTVSSGIGFAFGDLLFQLGAAAAAREQQRRRQSKCGNGGAAAAAAPAHPPLAAQLAALDWQRAGLMGAAGLAVAGPLGYAFILWMEGNVMTAAPHSRLALGVKLTLDQVLGFALWHAALAAIHEPHRQACLQLVRRPAAPASGAKAR